MTCYCLHCFDVVGWVSGRAPSLQKICVIWCWRGYLSWARCKWPAYGPADVTANHHCWLTQVVLEKVLVYDLLTKHNKQVRKPAHSSNRQSGHYQKVERENAAVVLTQVQHNQQLIDDELCDCNLIQHFVCHGCHHVTASSPTTHQ